MKKSLKEEIRLISEAGLLKRVKRSGWWVVGIDNPESVADHSFRCAVIGYILSKLEKADSNKVLIMTLFNDLHEARIGDLHKMSQRYLKVEKAEDEAFMEQVEKVDGAIKNELKDMRKEYRRQMSEESIIARDADILECLFQAKEYSEYGKKEALKFMKKAPGHLSSKSAKRLWNYLKSKNLNSWWEGLTSFKR